MLENIALAVKNLEISNLKGEITPITLPDYKRLKGETSLSIIKQSIKDPVLAVTKPSYEQLGLRLSVDGNVN